MVFQRLFLSITLLAAIIGLRSAPLCGDTLKTDLDRDGFDEAIVTSAGGMQIYRSNGTLFREDSGTGSLSDSTGVPSYQPGWPIVTDGVFRSSPAFADLDGDGFEEVIVGGQDKMFVWTAFGDSVPGWPESLSAAISATPALADIDHDARLEVVVGTWNDYRVYAFNGEDASVVDGWPVRTYGYVESSAAIGDVDNDGDLEIVVGDSWWGGHAWLFEADGETAGGWPIDVQNNVVGSPSLADLDGDLDLEIVLPSSIYWGTQFRSKLWVWHHDGEPLGNWPVTFMHAYERAEGNPMIGDIDGDNELELIVGTGNGSGVIPNLYAFNLDATNVYGWPLSGEDIYTSVAAADIDKDNQLEIALGSWSDYAMHCWELGEGSVNNDQLQWPKYHHDLRNTGLLKLRPISPVNITTEPDSAVVAPGDTLPMKLIVTNPSRTDTTPRFQVAMAAQLEGGGLIPILYPFPADGLILAPGRALAGKFDVLIPEDTPVGLTVTIRSVVLEYHTQNIYDEDDTYIEVTDPGHLEPDGKDGWLDSIRVIRKELHLP